MSHSCQREVNEIGSASTNRNTVPALPIQSCYLDGRPLAAARAARVVEARLMTRLIVAS
jgi:hypothetical protein